MPMLNYQKVSVYVKILGEASFDATNIIFDGGIRNVLY